MNILVLFGILGLCFGSFGTVLIYRLPGGQSILGRSKTLCCKKMLQPIELIPIFSFLFLRGRCARCGAAIPRTYAVIELSSAALFVFAALREPTTLAAVLLALVLWLFLVIACIDALHGIIPDVLSVPLIFLALFTGFSHGTVPVLAGAFGGGFFALQWALSRGKAMGSGDIGLGLGLGLGLGTIGKVLIALWFSYVAGAMVGIFFLYAKKKTLRSHLPFGPFIAFGFLVALAVDEQSVFKLLGL